MPFASQEEKARAGGSSPRHFLPHRTLALNQLQTGSMMCASDLKVKKALLPKLSLPDLHFSA